MASTDFVSVLGAGYSGLTTAAELTLRGHRVRVISKSLGYCPPLTIAGTQSRRWPGTAVSNKTFDNDELLARELTTLTRFMALSGDPESGVTVVPALKVSRKAGQR
jgi:glycine/D-amino acid oxidase-like deaminating enzyme